MGWYGSILLFLLSVIFVYLIFEKIRRFVDYRYFTKLLREDGYTRGQAIDIADAHPEIWM